MRLFDLHCDTLVRLVENKAVPTFEFEDFDAQTTFDLSRAAALADNNAHLSLKLMNDFAWMQCFAIFIPDTFRGETAWNFYQQIKRYFDEQLALNQEHFAQIFSADDFEQPVAVGSCAGLLTVEGASFFENTLAPLETLVHDGVKMIALTWNAQNALASGAQASGGLSTFGKQVVKEFEEHEIVIDVSHLNDESFWDVEANTTRPFAASHSNARAICNHPRNLSDDQFRAITEREGIVGLNLCDHFLVEDGGTVTPDDVLRHIDHWLTLGGEKAIALGTDYDGSDVPDWLSSGDKLPILHTHLAQAFGEQIADDLFFNNAYRFFRKNEEL